MQIATYISLIMFAGCVGALGGYKIGVDSAPMFLSQEKYERLLRLGMSRDELCNFQRIDGKQWKYC